MAKATMRVLLKDSSTKESLGPGNVDGDLSS